MKIRLTETSSIRFFKTYSEDLEYFSCNIIPTICYEGFENSKQTIFIGFGIYGMQFTYNDSDLKYEEDTISYDIPAALSVLRASFRSGYRKKI